MYIIYCSLTIGILAGLIVSRYEKKEDRKITLIAAPLALAFVGLVCGFCISLFLNPDIERVTKTEKIYSLKDNIKSCVFINGDYYNYYSKDSNEAYRLNKAATFRSKIKFTSSQPYVEIEYTKLEDNDFNKKYVLKKSVYEDPSYVFYVPEGSIISDYKLDSE